MFSQMARFASRMDVTMDDAEVDLRMAYDLRARKRLTAFATAAQMTDKGCHTVNSMRKRLPITGRLLFNDREFAIVD